MAARIAPFALLASKGGFTWTGESSDPDSYRRLEKLVWANTNITHSDPRAAFGAYAIASLLAILARTHSKPMTSSTISPLLSRVVKLTRKMESRFDNYLTGTHRIQILSQTMERELTCLPESFQARVPRRLKSASVMEAIPTSVTAFANFPNDFPQALAWVINRGGNTHGNAAIVGALVGANVGVEGIPEEWLNFRPDFDQARTLGTDLYKLTYGEFIAQ